MEENCKKSHKRVSLKHETFRSPKVKNLHFLLMFTYIQVISICSLKSHRSLGPGKEGPFLLVLAKTKEVRFVEHLVCCVRVDQLNDQSILLYLALLLRLSSTVQQVLKKAFRDKKQAGRLPVSHLPWGGPDMYRVSCS